MVDADELGQTTSSLQVVLDRLGVEWAIGGSLASTTWGDPRATNDLDVVARMDPDQARAFARALGDAFYADEDVAADAARHGASFNVIDQRNFLKVDVFVPHAGPMGLGQLARRRALGLFPGRETVWVLGPEDTVLQKLKWYEIGGRASDRQWGDIVGVLRTRGEKIDATYLTETAQRAGLGELLARARTEAGEDRTQRRPR